MLSPEVYTFLLAMSPVVEARGAIPYGVLSGMDPWAVFLISTAGNLFPVPLLLMFLSRVDHIIKSRKETNLVRKVYEKYVGSLRGRAKGKIDRYGFWGLMLFVAVPMPGTGAWTGSLVAYLFGLENKRALLAISAGVIAASLIVYTLVASFGMVL